MNCGYQEKTVLYFYGELAGDAALDVEEHLRHCGECAASAAVLRGLAEDLDAFRPRVPGLQAEDLVTAARGASLIDVVMSWSKRFAVATAFTAVFLAAFMSAGVSEAKLGWTGPDAALSEAESGVYNLSEDVGAAADFDYECAEIEARGEAV